MPLTESITEARFTDPRPECPHPEYWTSEDDQATENEVMDLVWGLIRALQPEYILETGSYHGKMAARMCEAVSENKHGLVSTIENDMGRHGLTVMETMSHSMVTQHHRDSLYFVPARPIDFAWFDTDPAARVKEFKHFYPYMHNRTVVCFHDTSVHHNIIKQHVLELTEEGLLVPVFLPTPRGVAICQVFKGDS